MAREREQRQRERAEMRAAELLSSLPRIRYAAPGKLPCEECSLCLDEYCDGEEVLRLNCTHLFHENCLAPWLTKSTECPLCKQDVA